MADEDQLVVYTSLHNGGVAFTLEVHNGKTLPQPHMVVGGARAGSDHSAVRWLAHYHNKHRKTTKPAGDATK